MVKDAYDAKELLKMLSSNKKDNTRSQAYKILMQKGMSKELEVKLIQSLRNEQDESKKLHSLFLLQDHNKRSSIPILLEIIQSDEDSHLRKTAIMGLGNFQVRDAVPRLLEILQSSDNLSVKQSMIFTLSKIGDPTAIPVIKKIYLTRRNWGLHERINLGYALDELARKNGKRDRYNLFQDGEINQKELDIDFLLEKLETGERDRILEELKENERSPYLDDYFKTDEYKKRHLEDKVRYNKSEAIEQLTRLSSFINKNEEIRKKIVESVSIFFQDETYLAQTAIKAIHVIGRGESVETLKPALQREDWVSWYAVEALGKIGTEEAIETIIEVLRNQIKINFNDLRLETVKICGKQLLKETIPVLIEQFQNETNNELRYQILNSLNRFTEYGSEQEKLENILIQEIEKQNIKTEISTKAIEILGKIESKNALTSIMGLLQRTTHNMILNEILFFMSKVDRTGIIKRKKDDFIKGEEGARIEITSVLIKMGMNENLIETFVNTYFSRKPRFEIQEYHLPLFILCKNPVDICILNNKILGFEGTNSTHMFGGKAFELLNELFSHEVGKSVIPKELYKFLIEKEEEEQQYMDPCLSGCYEDGVIIYYRCLELDLKILNDSKFPIVFTNMKFEQKKLDTEVKLSSEESFFILSNLCVESIFYDFYRSEHFNLEESLNKLENIVEEARNKNYFSISPFQVRSLRFCLEYLNYIKNRISKNTLKPIEILRTGGIRVLAILRNLCPVSEFIDDVLDKLISYTELSFSEKLIFYTLVNSHELLLPKILEFKNKYRNISEKIKKELSKEFRPLIF